MGDFWTRGVVAGRPEERQCLFLQVQVRPAGDTRTVKRRGGVGRQERVQEYRGIMVDGRPKGCDEWARRLPAARSEIYVLP